MVDYCVMKSCSIEHKWIIHRRRRTKTVFRKELKLNKLSFPNLTLCNKTTIIVTEIPIIKKQTQFRMNK